MTYSMMSLLVMWMTTFSFGLGDWEDSANEYHVGLSNVAQGSKVSKGKDSGLLLGDNWGHIQPLLGIEDSEDGEWLGYAARMSQKRHSDAGPAYAAAGQIAGRQDGQKASVWVVERFEGDDVVMESVHGSVRMPRQAFPGVQEGSVIEWRVNFEERERRLALGEARIERIQKGWIEI